MSDTLPDLQGRMFDSLPWEARLELITQMMRQVSRLTDPQQMVHHYGQWVRRLQPIDRFVALSRRDLLKPYYRITRSSLWEQQGRDFNPWKQRDSIPILDRGFLGELLYAEKPVVIDDFQCPSDDPAFEHLNGFRSMTAMPIFENGVALNMTITLNKLPGALSREDFPNRLWLANLFGRATKNLVLTEELQESYDRVDRELKVVADLQRSLLPKTLPSIQGMELAAFYQTSRHAGGDYYDFFEIDDGSDVPKFGLLIADVSGHGTPAAVMMAVTHSIAHTRDEQPAPPSRLLTFINEHLTRRYMGTGMFVTAFYGIYDPETRQLVYCNAGHNPPIVKRRCGSQSATLDSGRNLPLGILDEEVYENAVFTLEPGDTLLIYTDGITESRDPVTDDLFGTTRLDEVLAVCPASAQEVIDRVVAEVEKFSQYQPAGDDRTLIAAVIR